MSENILKLCTSEQLHIVSNIFSIFLFWSRILFWLFQTELTRHYNNIITLINLSKRKREQLATLEMRKKNKNKELKTFASRIQ